MRSIVFGVVVLVLAVFAGLANAQQTVWVQIEAQRSLARAQEVARDFSSRLQGVTGFSMRSGWYAIAIGPFDARDAEDVLQQLRVTRQVPGDSYVVDGSQFGRQFWPIGAATNAPLIVPDVAPVEEVVAPIEEIVVAPIEEIVVQPLIAAEETQAEARHSERQLSREERMLLQRALQWEGFYTAAIDGSFGRGTRRSMGDWQRANGFEDTGILTTLQRGDLVAGYLDILTSLGMEPLVENVTGIVIDLPTTMVKFDRYEPPFAHFDANGASGAKVLLISQTGDRATLRGLYDIMQTLEIVPLEGARNIGRREFTLTGQNSELYSHTYARLADGHVKGFTLIWTGDDDRRRDLVISAMRASFAPFGDAVLPDVYGASDAAQAVDLLAGLEVRRPDIAASGFYVDRAGAIVTAASNVQSCSRVIIDDEFNATVVAIDPVRGFALLRPDQPMAPIAVAQLASVSPRLNSEIAVAGFSYGGLLGAPTLTYGTLADLRGLDGDRTKNRLAVAATKADAGGPVLSGAGAVLGLLLPPDAGGGRKLPEDVGFLVSAKALAGFLADNGVDAEISFDGGSVAPEDMSALASDMTVLVSCWN